MFMLSETRKTKKRKNGELYRKSKLDILFDIINYTFFISFTLLCLFPFYYILINTISDNGLVRAGKINFIPQGFHLKNYLSLFAVNDLSVSFWVTLGRTLLGTALMVISSGFVGYLVTKKQMWGRKIWYRMLIISMYFNAGLIPWYMNMSTLGLTNRFAAYIIPSIVVPYNIILVKTYIESIPEEIEESARIDGAGYLVIFKSIIFPLSKPILATIAVFGAVGHWNSFTDSLILMQSNPSLYTLQHRLYIYLNTSSNLKALMQSGGVITQSMIESQLNSKVISYTISMITAIPILLVYPFMQRYFEKGIMMGAVKG
ncbi:MAG: carbohydrate ABC transporter permease [Clostridiales bacterium]|nr:carbohydrate ABC transporter permease [Clostridiales bacterium]